MRLSSIFLLCLLFNISAFSQKPIVSLFETENRPILTFKSEIRVGGFGEYIIAKKFLYDETALLLVTNYGVQLWDVERGIRLESRPHEMVGFNRLDSALVLSPDGRKAIVLDTFNLKLSKIFKKKAIVPATVWSLENGGQLAVLQRPDKPIRRARWSADSKTLVTFSSASGIDHGMEAAFWDGETLAYRGSIYANDWNYLTRDGKKFITTAGGTKNTFGYKYEKPNGIIVWNAETGKVEKTFSLSQGKRLKNIQITGDERFLLAETGAKIVLLDLETGRQQVFSAKDGNDVDEFQLSADKRFLAAQAKGKVLVWETGGNGLPKFEITPPPSGKERLSVWLLGFSPDRKSVAVSQIKFKQFALVFKVAEPLDTEFYDLETGKLTVKPGVFIHENNGAISADRKYGIQQNCGRGTVVNLENHQELYGFPLRCKSYETTSTEWDEYGGKTTTETHWYNDDIISFHPSQKAAVVVRDDALEVYSVNPEEKRLQSLLAPDNLSKKFTSKAFSTGTIDGLFDSVANQVASFNKLPENSSAGFILGGDYFFAMSQNRRSIFIWLVDDQLIK
ncbi:MAG TPA: hypothetical protein VK892_07195 [Pyrinomonadaceae bacterium]|nr:hypothetical protein [Pyrinomonadaceae bacterium]